MSAGLGNKHEFELQKSSIYLGVVAGADLISLSSKHPI